MVLISKAEKEAIIARYPRVNIVRTMKQKSKRHRYYCEETPQVMRFLQHTRGGGRADKAGKDVLNADKQKGKRV